jgi:hypothetical protein
MRVVWYTATVIKSRNLSCHELPFGYPQPSLPHLNNNDIALSEIQTPNLGSIIPLYLASLFRARFVHAQPEIRVIRYSELTRDLGFE